MLNWDDKWGKIYWVDIIKIKDVFKFVISCN